MNDYRCQIHGQFFDGSNWNTRLHVNSASTEAEMWTTWSEAVSDMWTNETYGIQEFYPILTEVTSVSVATLDEAMHIETLTENVLPLPGVSTADTLPILNSTLVRLTGTGRKRYQRGRMFFPAMAETFVNNDVVIPTTALQVGIAVTTLCNSLRAAGGTIFVYNADVIEGPPLIPAFTHQTITKSECSNKPARQSRRADKKTAVYY